MSPSNSTSSFKPAPQAQTGKTVVVPTVSTVVSHWKSTVSGLLTVVVSTGMYFAAVPSEQLQGLGITQKQIFFSTIIVGLAKVYMAMITKDAK